MRTEAQSRYFGAWLYLETGFLQMESSLNEVIRGLSSTAGVLIRRGNLDADTHRGMPREDKCGRGDASACPGMLRTPANPQKLEGGLDQTLHHSLRRKQPADALILTFLIQTGRRCTYASKPPRLENFLQQPRQVIHPPTKQQKCLL